MGQALSDKIDGTSDVNIHNEIEVLEAERVQVLVEYLERYQQKQ